jgi:hypothetical protein
MMNILPENHPLATIVCGFERGGTTLLSEILRQHPQLDSGFEGGFLLADEASNFGSIEPYYTNLKTGWGLGDSQLNHICAANTWSEVYQRLIEQSPIIKNKDTLVFDKTPKYMQLLSNVLSKVPNIPCIVLVRDPRAILYSWFKRSGLKKEVWLEKTLSIQCQTYLSYALGWKTALENGFGDRLLLVNYENLCSNTLSECQRIFDFIGLDFHSYYLSFKYHKKYGNVYGGGVSLEYLTEYQQHFSDDVCQQILKATEEFSNFWWHPDNLSVNLPENSLEEVSKKPVITIPEDASIKIVDAINFQENFSEKLWGVSIDLPKRNTYVDSSHAIVGGWAIGKPSRIFEIELICDDKVIQRIPVNGVRPDVGKAFPQVPNAENSGFTATVKLIGMPSEAELLLQAIFEDESCVPLGVVRFLQKPLNPRYESVLSETKKELQQLQSQVQELAVDVERSQFQIDKIEAEMKA